MSADETLEDLLFKANDAAGRFIAIGTAMAFMKSAYDKGRRDERLFLNRPKVICGPCREAYAITESGVCPDRAAYLHEMYCTRECWEDQCDCDHALPQGYDGCGDVGCTAEWCKVQEA